jgi:RNA polymerase sigma-70 factor (sigma-E family)
MDEVRYLLWAKSLGVSDLWRDLYDQMAPDLVRTAFLLTGDRELAQDLSQEAFVKVMGRPWAPRSPGAYLNKVLINLCRSHARRKLSERRKVLQLQSLARGMVHHPGQQERDDVWDAVRALPFRQRAAVVLRYCEDLSEQETADLLGTSVSAVSSLTARGLSRLRSSLEDEQ